MHVRARMHLNCANERNQTQKATYYMISCQWISGKGTTIHTEMAQLFTQKCICGCQGTGVEEGVRWQIHQGSIFEH